MLQGYTFLTGLQEGVSSWIQLQGNPFSTQQHKSWDEVWEKIHVGINIWKCINGSGYSVILGTIFNQSHCLNRVYSLWFKFQFNLLQGRFPELQSCHLQIHNFMKHVYICIHMYTFDMPKDEAKSINLKKLLFCILSINN